VTINDRAECTPQPLTNEERKKEFEGKFVGALIEWALTRDGLENIFGGQIAASQFQQGLKQGAMAGKKQWKNNTNLKLGESVAVENKCQGEVLKSDEFSFVFLRRLRFGDGRRPIAL